MWNFHISSLVTCPSYVRYPSKLRGIILSVQMKQYLGEAILMQS